MTSYQRRFDRRIFLVEIDGEPLEVEFTKYDFRRRAETVRIEGGVEIDDPIDILANKIAALADRHDPKDEVDLYFLLDAPDMPSFRGAVQLAEQKFGTQGLRYVIQSRLLAVSPAHPPTTPAVSRDEIARKLRDAAKELVAAEADPRA